MIDEAWHDWRRKGIGGSDIAGIVGVSPWASPYSVWQSKIMGDGPDRGSEAMQWGTRLERAIADETAERLGIRVFGEQSLCVHGFHDWARATVDAFYSESNDEPTHDGVLEIKTTSAYSWDAVPDYYALQVQWQLEVADLNHGWVAALHNGRKLTLWSVERDKELGASLLDVAGRFWEHNVLGMNPPDVDGTAATTEALARQFPAAEPDKRVDLTGMAEKLTLLEQTKAIIKEMTEAQTHVENMIKQQMGDATAGTIGGVDVITWKNTSTKRFDVTRFREENPDTAAQYMTANQSRRFLLK